MYPNPKDVFTMPESHENDVTTGIQRRFFLKGAAITVGGAALSSPLLAACGGSSSSSSSSKEGNASASAAALPTFVNALVAKPDLPGTPEGVQPGFTKALASYPKSVKGEVGSGKDVSILLPTYNPPPPPPGGNAYLQALNKATNTNLKMQVTPAADYPAKFASVTAGNDLPDLVLMPLFMNLPRLPDLLKSRFSDISDYVSGDKVKDYPNLAGIPTYTWKMARIRGRIYGVPLSRPVFAANMLVRNDQLKKAGLAVPTSADEFEKLCKDYTDAKAGRWALGSDNTFNFNIQWFAQMYGAPFRWGKKDDGTLVKDYETDEYAEAVAYAAKLRKAGYFHPDAGTVSISATKDQFGAGKVLMYLDGTNGWKADYDVYGKANPGMDVQALVPFTPDGSKVTQYFDNGIFALMGLKKADPDRVKELLRVLNYFAAPFGSEENLLVTAGVEGVDHTMVNGLPTLTDRGKLEQNIAPYYIGSGQAVLANTDYPKQVTDQHSWQEKVADHGVPDPTAGLYSDTNGTKGPALTKTIDDAVRNIISGRASIDSLKSAVSAWRSGGGDAIRKEFEAELSKSG